MPPPASATQRENSEAQLDFSEQMNRWLAEAQQKLQAAAREAVKQAVTSEKAPLLEDLQSQIKEAEGAVQKAAALAAERGAEVATAKLNEAQTAAFQALRAELPNAIAPQIEQASMQLSAELAKAGTAQFAAFDGKLQSALQAAQSAIDQLSSETRSCIEKLQASLQRFEAEADNRAQTAHQRWEQASLEQFDKTSTRHEDIAHADERLRQQLSAATDHAASNWRVRLEADLALAGSRWEQTIESSLEAAANRAAQNFEHRRQASTEQLEQEWGARAEQIRNSIDTSVEAAANRAAHQAAERAVERAVETMEQRRQASLDQVDQRESEWSARADQIRNSIESVVREAESAVSSLRNQFENESARALSSIAEMRQATAEGKYFAAHLESLSQSAIAQAQSQLQTLVAAQSKQFAYLTEDQISAAGERIQPLLESAGRDAVERLATEFEARFASQLGRAKEILEKLAAAEKLPESLLRVHQEQMERISEQSRERAVERLKEELSSVEKGFQQKAQTTQTTWLAELEKRASEVQVAAADSMFKSAEWHQKRAESQAQAAFEKKIEEAAANLREKAGALSGVFAAELDHYSRSFVEHSQSQMDEAVKETFERARGMFSEVAETTVAAFTDEIQRGAHGELDAFQQSLEKSAGDSRTQMESEVAGIQATFRSATDESLTDFQKRMAEVIETGVLDAGQQLERQLQPVMQTWRDITEKHNHQIQENYERLGDESVNAYKKRLENVSNSWMVATVSTLDRQSQELIAGVAKSAEERLRDTCSQVFASVGDTLRARLQEIAASLTALPVTPEK
jgi:hypothetical protein